MTGDQQQKRKASEGLPTRAAQDLLEEGIVHQHSADQAVVLSFLPLPFSVARTIYF